MRLQRIQDCLKRKEIPYRYTENDGCGGIEFIRRGLAYHIWEYPPEEPGCASNVRQYGRMEDFDGDYETAIIAVLEDW
ncbi:MAG: kinase [Oscillospiraceae bacterium]|nr:kinase [Oscillospiraceae bacterium]